MAVQQERKKRRLPNSADEQRTKHAIQGDFLRSTRSFDPRARFDFCSTKRGARRPKTRRRRTAPRTITTHLPSYREGEMRAYDPHCLIHAPFAHREQRGEWISGKVRRWGVEGPA